MTFIALPPEVNVGRLMTGAGPAPATAAAAAWAAVAASVSARSAFLTALLPRLAASWQAPETSLMTRNVAMYLAHNEGVRVQSMLASTRHTKQAADYSAALAGMAQIPEITQNHVTNAVLHATNFLGVNTAAIAANEAEYAGMWAQNASMMTVYLANSVANMTFEPFIPPKPMATAATVPIPAAAAGAASVGDAVVTKMTLAAQGAYAVAGNLAMRTASGVLSGTKLAQTVMVNAQRVEQIASNALSAQSKTPDSPSAARPMAGQELGRALAQATTAVPIAAGSAAGAAAAQAMVQAPITAAQPVVQAVGGGIVAQPLSQLMSTIGNDNRTSTVGYYGARPGSPALERIARGERISGAASSIRATGIGAMPQYAAPSNWQTDGLMVAPPPPVPRVPVEPLRPIQPVAGTAPVARSQGKQRERAVVPDTSAVMPIYRESEPEVESVPVDAPSGGDQT